MQSPGPTPKGLKSAAVNVSFILKPVGVKFFWIRKIMGVVVESDLN